MRGNKPDATANAIIRRVRKKAREREGQWLPTLEFTNKELRALLTEASQSAARECAEIAEQTRLMPRSQRKYAADPDDIRALVGCAYREVAHCIREHFGLEEK